MLSSLLQFARHPQTVTPVVLAIGLISCTPTSQPTLSNAETRADLPQTDLPQVVATSTVLCDLTRQIAQDTVALTCLLPANQDPHLYSPTPSDRQAIETADLILYGGYHSEPALIKLIQTTNTSVPKVAVYEAAVPDPLLAESDEHEHEHEEGQAHGTEADPDHAEETTAEAVPDPHIWHAAANGAEIAAVIQTNLATLSPDRAEQYQQNTTALTAELTQLNDWIKTQTATVPAAARQLITPHNAFTYFAQAYDFTVKGALSGLSTEERPSAARLAELVNQIKSSGVTAIFAEVTTNPKLIETVAREADVTVADQPLYLEGPGGEDSSAPTYQTMLVENTCTVVNALGGQCDRTTAPIRSINR